MSNSDWQGFFSLNPRRKTFMVRPELQLRLPVYLLGITLCFASVLLGHAYVIYERLYAMALAELGNADFFDTVVRAQTGDFLVVTGVISFVYVLVVLAVSIVHAHKLVGPTVAFRRQIEALKSGDNSARVKLRRGDAFGEVARDLNELAGLLELREKGEPS